MRRTPRVRAVTLAIGVLLATPGLAVAEPASPDTLGELVAAVANTNQKLQDLGAAIQAQQESVNKAIVDVQTARDNAAAAQQEVTPARSESPMRMPRSPRRSGASTPSLPQRMSTARRIPT